MCRRAGVSHAPHVDKATQEEILRSTPPYLRDARSKGDPALGSGAIYPVSLDDVLCNPFKVPEFWPRAYGMDVGWRRTAVAWGALDTSVDVLYIWGEYYRGKAEPSIHTTGIQARGAWIPGVIDPSAGRRSEIDGKRLLQMYCDLGLILTNADNSVDTGLLAVWERLSTGRLRIFRNCQSLQNEYTKYRRDENGQIVKKDDHLMDALRYLVMSGLAVAKLRPKFDVIDTPPAVKDMRAGY